MPVTWFDDPKNHIGTLTDRLTKDCYLVNNVTTTTLSILIQNISSLLAGIIIAFAH
jgi:ATP-binding cassette subfamily B (MDR/TAP) protein 1